MSGVPLLRRRILFLGLMFLACVSSVHPKEKLDIPSPPPMAKTGMANVYLDQPAEIPLQIAGRIVEPLTFLIRKEPKFGQLSALQRTGRNSAVILYTPARGARAGDDYFTFAAQSADSPVSAQATVWVRLMERPSVLEFARELDFGTVFLGDKAERSLQLTNSGGGVAAGSFHPGPPWAVEGAGDYRVGAGAGASLRIVFAPSEERDFSEKIQMGADAQSVVALHGVGLAPVSWPKDGLVFAPADRGKGVATVTFRNASEEERKLTISWPDFLIAPSELLLAPSGSLDVVVKTTAPPAFHVQGEVQIQSGNFQGRLPLRIFPAPPKLEIIPKEGLKWGDADKGRPLKGRFVVKNSGGSDAPLQIIAPPEVQVMPDPSNLILAGGQELAFDLQMECSGNFSKSIRIQSPSSDPVDLPVAASLSQPPAASAPVETFLKIPSVLEPVSSNASYAGTIPPAKTADLVASENHRVEIAWKVASEKATGFRIEKRRISPGPGIQVLVDWVPWPEARITISEGMAHAVFERLPANAFWTIRIVALDEKGIPSPPSPAFQIATQPIPKMRIPLWAWIVFLTLLAAALTLLWKKLRRDRLARDNDRIARIEHTGGR